MLLPLLLLLLQRVGLWVVRQFWVREGPQSAPLMTQHGNLQVQTGNGGAAPHPRNLHRCPLFHFQEAVKAHVLILNKSDLIEPEAGERAAASCVPASCPYQLTACEGTWVFAQPPLA